MKSAVIASLSFAAAVNAAVQGFDISHYQPNVNFAAAVSDGAKFVIIKVSLVLPQQQLSVHPCL